MVLRMTTAQGLGFLLIMALSGTQALADENLNWDVKVGMAALSADLPFKGNDLQFAMAPYVDARIGNWQFGVEQLVKYQYPLTEQFKPFASLKYVDQSFDAKTSLFSNWSDDSVFNGYESRDGMLLLTGGFDWHHLNFAMAGDIANNSEATMAQLYYKIPLYRGDRGFAVSLQAGVNWYSQQYVNYYYGITNQQVDTSVGRFAYNADAAVNLQAGVNVIYPLNKKWTIIGMLNRDKLDDSITNSPLIDSQYQDHFSLVVSYQM